MILAVLLAATTPAGDAQTVLDQGDASAQRDFARASISSAETHAEKRDWMAVLNELGGPVASSMTTGGP